jgi:nucleotide-binding universal stress UspA family protein
VHTVVVRSDPRTALLEAAERASVVVVGSRGRGPVASLLLGSVGSAVAGHSHCPAVVVRPHHHGQVRRGVLVAVDGSAGSPAVLEFAYRQASEKDLPLTVLHTVWVAFASAVELDHDDTSYDTTGLTLAEATAGLGEKYPDVNVTKVLMRGAPKEAIMKYADTMNLVVLGHGRLDPVSRALFGSVALSVVEHAKTVVAVVPQP